MGQPTEGALLAAAMKHGMYNVSDKYIRLQEIPYSSEQKMMAVKCVAKFNGPTEELYYVKGALEKILSRCTRCVCNGQVVALNNKREQEYLAEAHEIGRKGLRVVAMAKGPSMNDLTYMGIVGISDPPRPMVQEAIRTLVQSGVQVKMLTGDAMDTAVAIGKLFLYQLKRFSRSLYNC